ncbi:unnamed protein product [Dovyalis caffra]|uniref:Helicase C-terminal domain-containing protein n=1 Tax=Dovyalis caffra TaxID=77055 RepID=A0AAV1RS85_9ROSI|nr:unnamed protein product [Dovyalis caffra]
MPSTYQIQASLPVLSSPVLFLAPTESFDPENPNKSSRKTPSKVLALIKHLKDENSTSKLIVFSLFDKMLVLLEELLKDAGFINTLRLDASTDVRKTAEMIKEFDATGPDTVLLASLKSLGGSINMTVASEVYLLEPWWNSEVEEQAIDHVHQYGQQEDVEIIRLIAENTIEERILEMQKKKLENEAS